MNNEAWTENYFRPKSVERGLLDIRLLEKFKEDLIVTTACYYGMIPMFLADKKFEKALYYFNQLNDLFDDDFYIEIADHDFPDEKRVFDRLIEFGKKNNKKIIIAQDAHYLNESDWAAHELLIATRFNYFSNFKFPNHNFYLKNSEEMFNLGFDDEYYKNTIEILDKVEEYSKIMDRKTDTINRHFINKGRIRKLSLLDAFKKICKYKMVPTYVYFPFKKRFERGEYLDKIIQNDGKIKNYFESNPSFYGILKTLTGIKTGIIPLKDEYFEGTDIIDFPYPILKQSNYIISQWC